MSKKTSPSMDSWLKEAKAHESAPKIGMYLTHISTLHTASQSTGYESDRRSQRRN